MNPRVLTQVTHGLAFILSLRTPGEQMKCQMTEESKYFSQIQKEGKRYSQNCIYVCLIYNCGAFTWGGAPVHSTLFKIKPLKYPKP